MQKPKSIILFIADGMGIGQHTLAYYYGDGYSLDQFDDVGLVATDPLETKRVTDSAASANAYATGFKVDNGMMGLDSDGNPTETVLEAAESKGMATGLVTTAALTDATPGAFGAHYPNRGNHPAIARQYVKAGIEVLLGGGLPEFATDEEGNDLLAKVREDGVQVIFDLEGDIDPDRPILGLFHKGEMPVPPERTPTLFEMAKVAVAHLENDPDGFFLLLEDEGTDTESHRNNTDEVLRALADVMETVQWLLEYQKTHPELLIVFTGDHETGGFHMLQSREAPNEFAWATHGHTANLLPILATGPGSGAFNGIIDNTDVGKILLDYVRSK